MRWDKKVDGEYLLFLDFFISNIAKKIFYIN